MLGRWGAVGRVTFSDAGRAGRTVGRVGRVTRVGDFTEGRLGATEGRVGRVTFGAGRLGRLGAGLAAGRLGAALGRLGAAEREELARLGVGLAAERLGAALGRLGEAARLALLAGLAAALGREGLLAARDGAFCDCLEAVGLPGAAASTTLPIGSKHSNAISIAAIEYLPSVRRWALTVGVFIM